MERCHHNPPTETITPAQIYGQKAFGKNVRMHFPMSSCSTFLPYFRRLQVTVYKEHEKKKKLENGYRVCEFEEASITHSFLPQTGELPQRTQFYSSDFPVNWPTIKWNIQQRHELVEMRDFTQPAKVCPCLYQGKQIKTI